MTRTRTRTLVATAAATTALAASLVAAPAASAATCSTPWGSLTKSVATMSPGSLSGVRSGQHACYDRLVLDVAGGDVQGYTVQYVSAITQEGSGATVPVRGGARIQVTATVHGETYRPAKTTELTNVSGYRTFRQVVWAGSFEGYSSVGLGVRARLPFRVLLVDGPGTGSRLVVDVAHTW